MRHFYKHLDLFDKVFIVFVILLGVLSGIAGAWITVAYLVILLLFVFVLKTKDITISHQEKIIEELFETLEVAADAIRGRKIVKTTTFSLEKVKRGKDEKSSNEDKTNAGRSRSSSSRKRTASKKPNASRTGTASVSNRKPKATKKNSEA